MSLTLGGWVSQAWAIAQAQGLKQGLVKLNALPVQAVKNYQPFWALKAHLLKQLGCKSDAQHAYVRAIGLTEDAAIREFLLHQSLPLNE